ncbi:hypothetical protein [Sandaracinus amylolyticus]|uniref:Uncharacterized protein n=1 Tax=Sandaracinus amylolyticus TaxID=927083 RepID=A0A0F6YKQ8_9BACT|nr:hypothetical protein [Sandaracinus amylolyticus]AKF09438.1 hypothetical protein DB32_006587 [Sandaracinus amylolyticus]
MLQAHVLAVLAAIATTEDASAIRDARVAAYRRVPVGLRGPVRTRVTRAVSDAIFATQHGDDEAHVHRLAYLAVIGRDPPQGDDVAAVRAVFDEARAARPERERPSTARALMLGVVMLAVPIAITTWWLWPHDPYAALSEALPPSRGAYVEGGRPDPGTAAQRAVFEVRLPAFTIALDRWRASRDPNARAAVDAERDATLGAARGALGADTVSFLDAVLTQSIAVVEGGVDRHAAESHVRSVDALDAAIQSEGLAYYVDAEVLTERATGASRVYLSSFTVDNVAIYEAEGRTVRALRLRRLDRLNFARAVLGFTRPQVRDALVLGERVEEHLVQAIVPALAPDGALALSGDDDLALRDETARVAAAGVRDEAPRWLGGDAAAASELGAIFARRHALFVAWSERLSERGIVLREPDGYVVDLEPYTAFTGALVAHERRELEALVGALEDERHQRTYRAIEARFLASIERHEVQHRLDFLMGTLGTLPPRLEAMVGPLRMGDVVNLLAERSNAELSAYLSELARDATLVRASLALLLRHVFDRRLWGTAECHAALVILEGLADRLAIPRGTLVVARRIDRAEAARIHAAITARSDDDVQREARALWEELYQRPLPALRSGARASDDTP